MELGKEKNSSSRARGDWSVSRSHANEEIIVEIRKQRAAQRLHEIERQRVQIIDNIRMRADDLAFGNSDPYALKLTKSSKLSPIRAE